MSDTKTNHTYIFIHDQELLLEYEDKKKFKNLKNYTYVFVGNKDFSKIEKLSNVIISKSFEKNIEHYPLFTAFTGWYTLWKNNLCKSDYVTFMEYDVIINDNFEDSLTQIMNQNYDVVGYILHPMTMYHYIKNPNWVRSIFPAIKKIHNVDMEKEISSITTPTSIWSATNNVTFKKETLNEYMQWFEPLIEEIKDDRYCGHAQERAVSFFYFTKNKKVSFTNGLIKHFQLDSHGTQTHKVDLAGSINKLINNII